MKKLKQILGKLDIVARDYFHLIFKSSADNHLRIQQCQADKSGKIVCSVSFQSYSDLKKFQKKLRTITVSLSSAVAMILIAAILSPLIFNPSGSSAAGYTWTQTEWTAASNSVATYATQGSYSEYASSPVKDAEVIAVNDTGGSVSQTTAEDFSSGDANGDPDASLELTSQSGDASIRLTQSGSTESLTTQTDNTDWTDADFSRSNVEATGDSQSLQLQSVVAGNFPQTSGTTSMIESVDFVDSNVGYFVASTFVKKTTDGGSTWANTAAQPVTSGYVIKKVDAFSQDLAYVRDSFGKIYKTQNGGSLWSVIYNPASATTYLAKDMDFITESVGYFSGTMNADVQVSPTGCGKNSTDPCFETRYYFYTYKTDNGGASWTKVSEIDTGSSTFYVMDFYDSQNGMVVLVVGTYIYAYRTQNGGISWTPTQIATSGVYNAIEMTSADTAVAFGNGTTRRFDGTSWSVIPIEGAVYNARFLTSQIGYAVGYSGAYGILNKTMDGGLTWVGSTTGSDYLRGASFINSKLGYVAGNNGVVMKIVTESSYLDSGSLTAYFSKSSNQSWSKFKYARSLTGASGGSMTVKVKSTDLTTEPSDFSDATGNCAFSDSDGAGTVEKDISACAGSGQYLWYQASFVSNDGTVSPKLDEVVATASSPTYTQGGSFTSSVMDTNASSIQSWSGVNWVGSANGGSVSMEARSCDDDACQGEDWTSCTVSGGTSSCLRAGERWFQYRLALSGAGNPATATPVVDSVAASFDKGASSGNSLTLDSVTQDQEVASFLNPTASDATVSMTQTAGRVELLKNANLQALYNLNSSGTDSSGNNNTLTTVTATSDVVANGTMDNLAQYWTSEGGGLRQNLTTGGSTACSGTARVGVYAMSVYQNITLSGSSSEFSWYDNASATGNNYSLLVDNVQVGGNYTPTAGTWRKVTGPTLSAGTHKIQFRSNTGNYSYFDCVKVLVSSPFPWDTSSKKFGSASANTTVGSYLQTGASAISLGSAWTISAWADFSSAGNGTYKVLSQSNGATDSQIAIRNSDRHLGTIVGGAFSSSGYAVASGAGWHHVAVVGAGGKTNFYIDGSLVGSEVNAQSTSDVKYIGNASDGNSPVGLIDEFSVYGRNFSANEISKLAGKTSEYATSTGFYAESGTYTSAPVDMTSPITDWNTVSWINASGTGAVSMATRSCDDSACSGEDSAKSWENCSVVNGGTPSSACMTSGEQYFQYKATLAAPTDLTSTPSLSQVSINYSTGYPTSDFKKIFSSPFNTNSDESTVEKINWQAGGLSPVGGSVKFLIRTASGTSSPDWANGSGWCGPSVCAAGKGDTDFPADDQYFTTEVDDITNVALSDYDNKWIQYAVFMKSSDGTDRPSVDSVQLTYSFNTAPTVEIPNTIIQNSDGTVPVSFKAYETSAEDMDPDNGNQTSLYTSLFYQPDSNNKIELSTALDDSTTPATIDLFNDADMPIPSAGTILIGSELISYTGKSDTTPTVTLSGVTRNASFGGNNSFQTVKTAHAINDEVFILAKNFSTKDSADQAIVNQTWEPKADTNLGLDGRKYESMTLKVVASDGWNFSSQGTASQLVELDLEDPGVSAISANSEETIFGIGTIPVTVEFSEPVKTTGDLLLTFDMGEGHISSCLVNIADETLQNKDCSLSVNAGDETDNVSLISVNPITGTITDAFGNAITDPSAPATTSLNVRADGKGPEITSATATEDYYKENEPIVVTLNFSEQVKTEGGELVVAFNNGQTCDVNISIPELASSAQCTYTVGSEASEVNQDLKISDISMTAGQLEDEAGNATVSDAPTANLSNVVVDNQAPTVSAGDNQTKGSQFTQTGSADDGMGSGVVTYAWSGPGAVSFGTANAATTTISASANGSHVIRLTATDQAGNEGYDEFILTWDQTAPTASNFTINSDAAYTTSENVTVTNDATDSGGSELASASYGNQDLSDDFGAANLDTNKWTANVGTGTSGIDNGRLKITSTSAVNAWPRVDMKSTAVAAGEDFDAQVDYDITGLSTTSGVKYAMLQVQSPTAPYSQWQCSARVDGANTSVGGWSNDVNGSTPAGYVAYTPQKTGKLRAKRENGIINCYISDNDSNGWINFYRYSSGNYIAGSMKLNLYLGDTDGVTANLETAYFDNFIVWQTPDAPYSASKVWTLPWTTSADDGTKTIFGRFHDNAGNVSSTYSDTIALDTTAPLVTAPNVPQYTSDRTPEITWNAATENGSGMASYKLQRKLSSEDDSAFLDVTGAEAVAGTSFTEQADLSDGTYVYRIYATDNAGKVSSASANSSAMIVDDTDPQAVSISAINNNPNNSGNQTVVWGGVSDNGPAGFREYVVLRKKGAESFTELAVLPEGTTQYEDNANLEQDTYTYRIDVRDNADNSSTGNESVLIVDKSGPSDPGKPTVSPNPNNTGTQTISWSQVSNDGGSDFREYKLQRKSGAEGSYADVTTITDIATVSYEDTSLDEGTYFYKVTASDNAGNETTGAESDELFVDKTDPVIEFTDDIQAGPITSDSFAITTSDPNGNEDTAEYKYILANDNDCADENKDYGSAEIFESGVTEGTFNDINNNGKYVCAQVKDLAGNVTHLASENDINIDVLGPDFTMSEQDDVDPNPSQDDAVTVTVEDPNLDGATLKYVFASQTDNCSDLVYDSGIAYSSGTAIHFTDGNNNGSYICFTAQDLAGNASFLKSRYPLNVDVMDPQVSFADGVDVGPTTSDNINISVVEPNQDSSRYVFSGDTNCENDDYDNNGFDYAPGVEFQIAEESFNDKYLCARHIDQAGNVGYAVSASDMNIDRTAPALVSFTTSSLVSDLGVPESVYGNGEQINVQAVFGEELQNGARLTVKINNTAKDEVVLDTLDGTKKILSGTYTVIQGATHDTSALNISEFTIASGYEIKDIAGNGFVQTDFPADNFNGKLIVVDTEPPTLESFSATVEGSASGSFNAGKTVTVKAHYSENLKTGSVAHVRLNIAGATDVTLDVIDERMLVGTYPVAGGDNVENLKVTHVISQDAIDVIDNHLTTAPGNEFAVDPAFNNVDDGIRIDTDNPYDASVTINGGDGETKSNTVSLAISTSDNFPDLSGMRFELSNDGTEWCDASGIPEQKSDYATTVVSWNILDEDCGGIVPAGTENKVTETVHVRFTDGAGNTGSSTNNTITYDGIPPQITSITSSAADGIYGPGSVIPIEVTYSEEVKSGSTLTLTFDTGVSWTQTGISGNTIIGTYTVGDTGTGEDSGDLAVSSITQNVLDTADNVQSGTDITGTTFSQNKNIIVDTAAPTGIMNIDRSVENGKITVSVKPEDPNGVDETGMKGYIKVMADKDDPCDDFAGVEEFTFEDESDTVKVVDDNDNFVAKVCVKLKDVAGNESAFPAYSPETPENFKYTDISNSQINFFASYLTWKTIEETGSGSFGGYQLGICSVDKGEADCVPDPEGTESPDAITDSALNSFTQNGLSSDKKYCYRIRFADDEENISRFSQTICTIPGEATASSDTEVSFENGAADDIITDITNSGAKVSFNTVDSDNGNLPLPTIASVEVYDNAELVDDSENGKNLVGTFTDSEEAYSTSHTIQLSGLSSATPYFVKITVNDAFDNEKILAYDEEHANLSFMTVGSLSSITIDETNQPSVLTDHRAVISFATDQSAKCFVEYKEAAVAEYATTDKSTDSEFVKNHSIPLIDLAAQTAYDYRITCWDSVDSNIQAYRGFGTESDALLPSFTTLREGVSDSGSSANDGDAPEILSGPQISEITGESATVTWTTDELANSSVIYNLDGSDFSRMESNPLVNSSVANYTKTHSVVLNGLIPATKYLFSVVTSDSAGNIGQSSQLSLTTKEPSSLSSVKVLSKALNQATITWETGEATSSIVEYGLTTSYGETKESQAKTKDHEITISDLESGQTYHFRVKGEDSNGNLFASSDNTFEPKSPPKISDFKVDEITEHGAKITFATNVPTDALVTYTDQNSAENSGFQGRPEIATKHEVVLKGLASGTEFGLKLKVRDEDGNETEEVFQNFTTSTDENAPKIEQVRTDSALAQNDKVQAIISWKTDENADTKLVYKEGKAGKETEVNVSDVMTTSHIAVITTFKPGAVYYFNVKSIDAAGNEAKSNDFALLTPKRKENIIQIIVNNFQDIFGWAQR